MTIGKVYSYCGHLVRVTEARRVPGGVVCDVVKAGASWPWTVTSFTVAGSELKEPENNEMASVEILIAKFERAAETARTEEIREACLRHTEGYRKAWARKKVAADELGPER